MVSNQNHFITFQVLVLTTVLDHSQVIPSHINDDSWTNVFQLGTPKHMPRLYPKHKQDQPISLLSRGLGPIQTWTPSPHTWDPVSIWCLDLHFFPPPISRSRKSRNPRQECNKPSRSHKQVCAQDNKSVTWLPSTATDGPQLTQAESMQSKPRSNA